MIRFSDENVTLHHGDSLEVLAELAGASVDAVVTDPPYELGFMGKAWDASGIAYSVDLWREVLRVLKPGGHLLSFGGTRTWHRMVCAIEDAGFEIRDELAWLYGSGFPKSLDVSKAIDKARDDTAGKLRVTSWFADVADARGVTRADVDAHMGTSDMGGWWLSRLGHRCAVPTIEQIPRLLEVLGVAPDEVPDEIGRLIFELNGRKGQPGEAWFRREVVGERPGLVGSGFGDVGHGLSSAPDAVKITAPATPEAERWSGWGTAIKPAHEPVICARKPFADKDLWGKIGSQLSDLEAAWKPCAKPAESPSAPSPAGSSEAKTGSAPERAATQPEAESAKPTATGKADGSSEATATSASGWTVGTFLSIVTSWRACWVELCEATNTCTTSTATSRTTDLETLSSCLFRLMPSTMPTTSQQPPSRSLVSAVDDLFGACLLSLRSTLALSALASATESTLTSPQGDRARALSPAHEPICMARKPLVGTVAANVMEHGTGALNVDGCRIGTGEGVVTFDRAPRAESGGVYDHDLGTVEGVRPSNKGRWPANVVLDEEAAALLDRQSGTLTSGKMHPTHTTAGVDGRTTYGADRAGDWTTGGHADSGGASRFFYVAKAAKHERPRVDGKAHATVKPVELMRWLVRLVTPPGGLVLDPFAGSGTTAEACIVEGFRCVLIEKDADHLPLIEARLSKPIAPTLFGGSVVNTTRTTNEEHAR